MKKANDKLMDTLSNSILLKESGTNILLKIVLLVLITIFTLFLIIGSRISLNQVVITQGSIIPVEEIVQVEHFLGGTILNKKFNPGDLVNEGDVLIELDPFYIDIDIKDTRSKISNLNNQIKLLDEELVINKQLLDQELIPKNKYISQLREKNDLIGKRTQYFFNLERLRYKKRNINIVSPIKGHIQTLRSLTRGSIINPGEVILEIIPYNRNFAAEVKISASDRGKVTKGMDGIIKFKSYNFSKFGGMEGVLTSISPSTFGDYRGDPYYKSIVTLNRNYMGDEANKLEILPGMTVSYEINIGKKTLLEYLFLPVRASFLKAFNEP